MRKLKGIHCWPPKLSKGVKESRVCDYFLPSRDELNQMYVNLYLEGVGGFTNGVYCSSSEGSANGAYMQTFSTGNIVNTTKSSQAAVRACRSFTAGISAYSLRDIGPAGGYIFYINGTTYFEAAPSDQVDELVQVWSNIQTLMVGTGSAIGTGQSNTTAIINQAGHTDSAAKLCDDLIV